MDCTEYPRELWGKYCTVTHLQKPMQSESESEIERKLEQMRAIENGMKIVLGLIDELPISVDTQEDLEIARRSMDL